MFNLLWKPDHSVEAYKVFTKFKKIVVIIANFSKEHEHQHQVLNTGEI